MSQYDTRGPATFLLGGFNQGADVARSVQNQGLARDSLRQRQTEFDAENARQNLRMQMEQEAIARDLEAQQASAGILASPMGVGANDDFAAMYGGAIPGDTMQVPDRDPNDPTPEIRRRLYSMFSKVSPAEQMRLAGVIQQNREQFKNSKHGQKIVKMMEDFELSNPKILQNPKDKLAFAFLKATADFDPTEFGTGWNHLSAAMELSQQQDEQRRWLATGGTGMGPEDPTWTNAPDSVIGPVAKAKAMQMAGVGADARAESRPLSATQLVMQAAQDNPGAFEEANADLLSGDPARQARGAASMAALTGKIVTPRQHNVSPKERILNDPDLFEQHVDAIMRRHRWGEDKRQDAIDLARGQLVGTVNQDPANIGSRPPTIDKAREAALQLDIDLADAELKAVDNQIVQDGVSSKRRGPMREGPTKRLYDAIEAKRQFYMDASQGSAAAPAADTSIMSPREIRDRQNPSAGSPQTRQPLDGRTLLSEFAKQFPGTKPDRNNPQHVAAMRAIQAALERNP